MRKVRITESQLKGIVKRMIKEETDNTIMLSLGRKVYDDLKKQGFKVSLNQERKASNMREPRSDKYRIGRRGESTWDKPNEFYVYSYNNRVEVASYVTEYTTSTRIQQLNNAMKELKNKYESDDIEGRFGNTNQVPPSLTLRFSFTKKGNY